jgi:hypothetical protein
MSEPRWGTCSSCGTQRRIRRDGMIRFHQGCPGGYLPPAAPASLPELPPGYEITFSDDNADPKYNGWDIWIRGDIYDGREDEPLPQERGDAIDECWSLWLRECGPEWRAFVEALRGA